MDERHLVQSNNTHTKVTMTLLLMPAISEESRNNVFLCTKENFMTGGGETKKKSSATVRKINFSGPGSTNYSARPN